MYVAMPDEEPETEKYSYQSISSTALIDEAWVLSKLGFREITISHSLLLSEYFIRTRRLAPTVFRWVLM